MVPAEGGNVSQMPPLDQSELGVHLPIGKDTQAEDNFHAEIYANMPSATILKALFGPSPELRFIRTNTLHKTTARQMVHKDARRDHLPHLYSVAMNFCLIDCDENNGSTELWLGTASNTTADDHVNAIRGEIRDDCLDARAKVRPPIRPKLPKGSVVLRDVRLWCVPLHTLRHSHVGTPECPILQTTSESCSLSFGFQGTPPSSPTRHALTPRWYANENTMPFPESMRDYLSALEKKAGIKYGARFVPDEGYDYLSIPYEGVFSSSMAPPAAEVLEQSVSESKIAQTLGRVTL